MSEEMLSRLQEISPKEFEYLISKLFDKMGYETIVTQYTQDNGIDVVAQYFDGFTNRRILIQVKRYKGTVGVNYIRDLYGTLMSDLTATSGVLITTGSFSSQAQEFAHNKRIDLIDGESLVKLVEQYDILETQENVGNTLETEETDIAASFLMTMGPALQKIKIWEIQQKRKRLFQDGWKDAIKKDEWLQKFNADPKNKMAYYHLGNAAFEEGKYEQAIQYYSKALEIDPALTDALRRRGDCYYALAACRKSPC